MRFRGLVVAPFSMELAMNNRCTGSATILPLGTKMNAPSEKNAVFNALKTIFGIVGIVAKILADQLGVILDRGCETGNDDAILLRQGLRKVQWKICHR